MERDDGEAAFPQSMERYGGLTIRDWFAGQALVAMGTWCPSVGKRDPSPAEIRKARAYYAYAQADALLSARKEST